MVPAGGRGPGALGSCSRLEGKAGLIGPCPAAAAGGGPLLGTGMGGENLPRWVGESSRLPGPAGGDDCLVLWLWVLARSARVKPLVCP